MAERQGFEPWVLLPAQRFSRPPHSTALAPLRDPGRTLADPVEGGKLAEPSGGRKRRGMAGAGTLLIAVLEAAIRAPAVPE